MADKPQSALAIRKQAVHEARAAYKATVAKLQEEKKQLVAQNRATAAMARKSQEVAIAASEQNQSLLRSMNSQNSRAGVGATIFLSSVACTAASLGSNQFVLYLAKPSAGDTQPNFVARNRGVFEALPGFLLGGALGGWALLRASDATTEYGAGDEFLRNSAAALLTVGMVRGGDALLSPLPALGK